MDGLDTDRLPDGLAYRLPDGLAHWLPDELEDGPEMTRAMARKAASSKARARVPTATRVPWKKAGTSIMMASQMGSRVAHWKATNTMEE